MSSLTLFGLAALSFRLVMQDALERRHRVFILAFAAGCALSSAVRQTTPAAVNEDSSRTYL